MTQRIVHRGAASIRFLADQGVTFTLPYGHTKDKMTKGWNRPGAGVGAEQAIAHYERGNNVGVLCEFVTPSDIDFDFPEKVADLGDLAHTAKIWRDNAPARGALLYKVIDGPVQSATWKPVKDEPPHAELLAQTKTGNFAQKNVAGFHKGGEYCIVDAQYGIREITRADLALIWCIITGEELYAPKPPKPIEVKKPVDGAAPAVGHQHVFHGHDDLVAQLKSYWSTLAVFAHHGWVKNGTEQERNGAVRILGHGGLIIQRDGLWYNHSDQTGGDAIDAWAHCIRRDRDRYFVEILEEMANAAGIAVPDRFVRQEPVPLPEGAQVLDNGAIVLKTTPTPTPAIRPAPPVLTPTVVAKLAVALRGSAAIKLLERVSRSRNREMYRDVLLQLVTIIAPAKGSWVFDADQRWLGEHLKKSGMSAGRNMWALEKAGLIRYLHSGKPSVDIGGRPQMRVDLQPLIVELWESCVGVTNSELGMFVTPRNDPPVDVYATYSGAGKYADASMRTPYKYAVARTGRPTVLVRSMTASTLTTLDYLVRNRAATRAELVEGAGMSPGAAAGGTRVVEQLDLVKVEWEGPGTPKIYVLRPDWEARLRSMIPHMASYGAHIRLVIRTYDERIEFIDWQLRKPMAPAAADDLKEHKKKLEMARKKWCIYGSKVGAYGRYVEATPPW
jgi:hypothetical protein